MHRKLMARLLAIILTAVLFVTGCGQANAGQQIFDSNLKVHFMDVGQGDSVLVQFPNGQNMLVDAGNNEDGPAVVSYIKKQGIKRLDYVVGTHPHEDHIGGLDDAIKSFPVGKVYMPKVTHTTQTFEDVLLAVKSKGLKITPASAGVQVINSPDIKVSFLAPCGSGYENLNDWSAVTRVQYGKAVFLLAGDAGFQSESEMVEKYPKLLKADGLKVGHHGSRYSTSSAFLKAVSPKYAVISVGASNDYGHPHQETLKALADAKVKVFRTDLNGTIIATSNGQTITFSSLKNTVQPRAPNTAKVSVAVPHVQSYIGNKNSKKFHLPTCSSLPAPQNRVYFKTRNEVVKAGYVPCKVCNP